MERNPTDDFQNENEDKIMTMMTTEMMTIVKIIKIRKKMMMKMVKANIRLNISNRLQVNHDMIPASSG